MFLLTFRLIVSGIILVMTEFNADYRNVSSTRGNKYKLQNHSFHYNFRKFSFAARVVNVWNSLPETR